MRLMPVLPGVRERRPVRHCEVPKCGQVTREGKQYCSDHVDMHPYVQDLIRRLDEREMEDERVSRRGTRAVNFQGITVKEILLHLSLHGGRTEERLVRELNLELKVLQNYIQALRRKGLIKLGHTERGSVVVMPTVKGVLPVLKTEAEDAA